MTKETIRALSQQLDAAMVTLNKLKSECDCDSFASISEDPAGRHQNAFATAQSIFEQRRLRARHFPDQEIFGEPAWDILLDLYIHQSRNEEISVKSASIGSGAPASTALRWLKVLEEMNLIVSAAHETDQRRRLVRLTPEGYESMTRYLEEIAR